MNDVEAETKAFAFSAKAFRWILVAALGGAGFLSLSLTGTMRAAAECRAAWSEVATPLGSNSFYSVGAVGQNDVWAVGSRYSGVDDRPLAEHFDEQQWTIVPTQ